MKRTPLFAVHQKLGGRLIEFGGWEMPVQYSSIVEEHLAVRRAAGIFDISHMGEVLVSGPAAEIFLNQVLTNDIRKLSVGQGQYTLMCNERGGAIDDLYAYRLAADEYLLIINAARIPDDVAWLEERWAQSGQRNGVKLKNVSEEQAAVAIQGPRVVEFLDNCFPAGAIGGTIVKQPSHLKKNQIGKFAFEGAEVWVGRTGYTGEDGFEIIAPAGSIEAVWIGVLEKGRASGLKPAGLGARDTLRTEVCYPLYGHELDEDTTPIEAGLSPFVALDKGEFTGREVLAQQKTNGPRKKLVALKMTGRSAPPRPQYSIWSTEVGGSRLGEVTSGTQSPSLGIGIGLGYVTPEFAKPETAVAIEIRDKRAPAVVVAKPIYRKAN